MVSICSKLSASRVQVIAINFLGILSEKACEIIPQCSHINVIPQLKANELWHSET